MLVVSVALLLKDLHYAAISKCVPMSSLHITAMTESVIKLNDNEMAQKLCMKFQ
jgi:hypothetical protein